VEFFSLHHSHKLPHSWLLGACPAPARGSRACPACLFTVPGRIPFSQSSVLRAPHPLSSASLLFLLLITQFLFFSPGGGQSVQGAMLLLPRLVCGGTVVLQSSPSPRLPKLSGCQPLVAPGALLISPFNVKWRFSAPAGDVEGSKLYLFSVIMPAKCVSSVSPRFPHFYIFIITNLVSCLQIFFPGEL
jgi:hypothetical protein